MSLLIFIEFEKDKLTIKNYELEEKKKKELSIKDKEDNKQSDHVDFEKFKKIYKQTYRI